eukprot:875653-Amphidinium_carterae.1
MSPFQVPTKRVDVSGSLNQDADFAENVYKNLWAKESKTCIEGYPNSLLFPPRKPKTNTCPGAWPGKASAEESS